MTPAAVQTAEVSGARLVPKRSSRGAPRSITTLVATTVAAPPVTPLRVRPAPGAITGPYGERRGGHRHPGVDFDGDTGDPVVAAAAGAVTIAGPSPSGFRGYGNLVVVRTDDGVDTLYAHLSAFAVRVGDVVVPRQRIGAIGTTGQVTGSHLHFEVRRRGSPIDPMAWLAGG